MRAMKYLIPILDINGVKVGDSIEEMSIFLDKYHEETFFLFINRVSGACRLNVAEGQKRLNLIDKDSASVFEIDNDTFLVYDLADTLTNIRHDVQTLIGKYLPQKEKK